MKPVVDIKDGRSEFFMSDLITVLMCVYNGESFLREAIDSILAQTYDNFEFLIVDDGSTDQSKSIILGYSDPRIVLISNEINKGLIFSLNYGVAKAKGHYIARMDADDIADSKRLESQLAHIKSNDLDVVGASAKTFGCFSRRILSYPSQHEQLLFRLLFGSAFAHPLVFAKTQCLKDNPYSEKYPCAEDYELWCRLAVQGYRFGNQNEVLLFYREHSGQISQAKSVTQQASVYDALSVYSKSILSTELFAVFEGLNYCRSQSYDYDSFVDFLFFLDGAISELTPSSSDVNSFYLFFVRKMKNRGIRVAIDFIHLNKRMGFLFPKISDLTQILALSLLNIGKDSLIYRIGRRIYK